ncbi:MAG TPA: hypothetical protein VK760_15395 [Candidatus Acidoferrales bacterium]|jgi:hypothetical protein|nr:hypothetical protein [Candidatus Acidoferrales bacterium]
MSRFVLAILAAFLVTGAGASASSSMPPMELPPQPAVHPVGIPAGAKMVSPCVATMGEHWAALTNLPVGPIYGVYEGKPVFTEIMVSVKQLQEGFAYANIRALPGYTIDHVDFRFEPKGHPGMPVPHYDVHAYYVSPAAQAAICPKGVPDPSMKAMNER